VLKAGVPLLLKAIEFYRPGRQAAGAQLP